MWLTIYWVVFFSVSIYGIKELLRDYRNAHIVESELGQGAVWVLILAAFWPILAVVLLLLKAIELVEVVLGKLLAWVVKRNG